MPAAGHVNASSPLVTIGIPTYNRASTLAPAIRSALAQTYPRIEIVVSDNASTDDTASAVASFRDDRVRYFRHDRNRGMIANFNATLEASAGTYFLMLSDDDTLHANAVETLVAPLISGIDGIAAESIGISWSPSATVDSAGNELWTTAAGRPVQRSIDMIVRYLNGIEVPRFCSYVVRVRDLRSVGGYRERYGPLCDSASWIHVVSRYANAVCFPSALSRYTLHAASETSTTQVSIWLDGGRNLIADLRRSYATHGDTLALAELDAVARNFYSCLLAGVVLQKVGQPGWLQFALAAALRWPAYTFTPYVAGRLVTSMKKLLSLSSRAEFRRR